jgi:2-hydroxy-6-oxonona-2,4-dienedioate hydrolase
MVPGAGGLCGERAIGPPTVLLDAIYRFDFPMWAIIRLSPKVMYRLVAVPPSLVPSLCHEEKARLDEAIRMILPVSSRRLGVLNEGRTQRSGRQYPLEQVRVPTLLISAADDLYRTLPVARHAASIIPHARLIDFATGGHLLLGRTNEVFPAIARFLKDEGVHDALTTSGGVAASESPEHSQARRPVLSRTTEVAATSGRYSTSSL